MQTRVGSFVETIVDVILGFIISFGVQLILFRAYDIKVELSTNLHLLFWFTLTSMIRKYATRRFFNWLHK